MRRSWLALVAVLAVAAVQVPASGSPDDESRVRYERQPDCRPAESLRDRSRAHAEGTASASWLGSDEVDADILAIFDRVHDEADEAFVRRPREGFLGVDVDHDTREVVVVLEAGSRVDQVELADDLQARTTEVSVRLQAGCRRARDVERVLEDLRSERFRSEDIARGATFVQGLDPRSGTAHVRIASGDQELAEEIESRHGATVTVEVDDGQMVRTSGSRFNDVSPHYGGARLRWYRPDGARQICTSGFAADLRGGPRVMTTAAHCANANGAVMRNGQDGLYGTMRSRLFPNPDLARIEGRTYHRYIWTGGTSHRLVDRKVDDLSRGTAVCLSGATSGKLCGPSGPGGGPIRVIAINQELCHSGGCAFGLAELWWDNLVVARGGDSGGPAYGRHGTSNASARGIIIGGRNCNSAGDACRVGYVQPIRRVEGWLSVRIATQPGLEW